MDRLSIVVPVYNAADFLEQCINSILEQSDKNIEIILINDGSTDESGLICKRYLTGEPVKVVYYEQKNLGQIAARKNGLRYATGDWTLFMDADDWLDNETGILEKIISAASKSDADAVFYGAVRESKEKTFVACSKKKGCYKGNDLAMDFINPVSFYKTGIITSLWAGIYRTESIRHIMLSIPDEIRMSEDVACVWSFLVNANKVLVVDDIVYHYRVHEKSFCHIHDKNLFSSEKESWIWLQQQFSIAGVLEKLRSRVAWQIIRDLMLADYKLLFNYAKDFLYPYCDVKNGMKIAICGFGDMGQEYWRVLSKSNRFSVIMIGDEEPEKCGCEDKEKIVSKLTLAKRQMEVDKIVITVISEDKRIQIRDELILLGVDSYKIARFDQGVISESTVDDIFG